MLNIISRSILSNDVSGPKKVADNLIKGLDILGYPYCINKALDSTSQLWIHDDIEALKVASKLKLKAIIGPNLYVVPRNITSNIDMSSFIYIHPSKWVIDFWKYLEFNRCPLDTWPVGIDTEEFKEREKPKNGIVLVYFKGRYKEELDFITKLLKEENIRYEIISYGSYDQTDYLKKLKNTRYVVWLGKTESQGLALEEALSMNVPILVWDVLKIGHYVFIENKMFNKNELEYKNVTSAYYFDERCGVKTKNKEDLKNLVSEMEKEWMNYEPRKYIIENLSLEKRAKEFIELFDKYYNISFKDGKNESLKSTKKWINDKFYFKTFIFIKDKIKKCVKLLKK